MPKDLVEALGKIETLLGCLVHIQYCNMNEDEKCNCPEVEEVLNAARR